MFVGTKEEVVRLRKLCVELGIKFVCHPYPESPGLFSLNFLGKVTPEQFEKLKFE